MGQSAAGPTILRRAVSAEALRSVRWPMVVFGAALVPRLVVALALPERNILGHPDALGYQNIAVNLLAGHGWFMRR
jgi:hypothetical protein